ncbi:hypothetical protein BSZ32_14385 [Rubritalea profundi]|uniref:Sialate O-acetylesterase domain-containing protein n=1 Tax=Rubritalea profundi TaxID=1658618 RepID=A0A2S7U554_9BACT|nr:hypothetical protein BSZ32_14385 [Rubritalea profundi]
MKGVLWQQDNGVSQTPETHLETLTNFVVKLRSDFADTSLPFVTGQLHDSPKINAEIVKLPQTIHGTAYASSQGLTTADCTHFDSRSQLLLGERYAEQMIQLQQKRYAASPLWPRPTSSSSIPTSMPWF